MHIALIENAEHDVDRDQRGENQEGLVVERILKRLCRALEGAANRRGHADPVHGRFDGGGRRPQRDAFRQVERDGAGDKQALVIDAQRCRAVGEMRDRGQRNHRLLAGADGRAGRGHTFAGRADRVGGKIARGLGVGGAGAGRAGSCDDRSSHRVGRLGAADRRP